MTSPLAALIPLDQRMRVQYIGALALLARCSLSLSVGGEEDPDELRDSIMDALGDAKTLIPQLEFKRTLDRIDIDINDDAEVPDDL